jgi:hypothetical protein
MLKNIIGLSDWCCKDYKMICKFWKKKDYETRWIGWWPGVYNDNWIRRQIVKLLNEKHKTILKIEMNMLELHKPHIGI